MARLEFAYNSVENKLESEDIQLAIIKSLAYSEVFNYPLNVEEIFQSLELKLSDKNHLIHELEDLITKRLVFKLGEFYSLKEDYHRLKLRLERNHRAEKFMPLAGFISRFIGSFPFVRAVFISGSLSKNSMNKDSDIDYFIVTKPGRLWTARTLLILFKKVFLFNSYKFYCLNYFIDSDNLEITDRDLYIAHEIASLKPTYGKDCCSSFFEINNWIYSFLPNAEVADTSSTPLGKVHFVKYIMEFLLKGGAGKRIEKFCLNTSRNFWEKKFGKTTIRNIEEVSISRDYISTHHPDNFRKEILQKREIILQEYNAELAEINLAR